MNHAKPRLVVIGNGMAGARLVEDVLRRDRNRFDITVFGDEPYGCYNRILLSSVLNGSQNAKDIFLNPLSWYDENGVTLRAGVRITGIDRERCVVFGNDGSETEYDKLVLAMGSRPFVPPIEGADREGVFVFRTIDDCDAITEYAHNAQKALVIGGGLLGLESARGLLTHDVDVTVVEMGDHLMTQQLDATGGALLGKTMEAMGVTVLTNRLTSRIVGETRVLGIEFKDGEGVDTDMVVISAGIRANAELAKEAGIATERGVLVDDRLQTDDPNIYAVGEVAQHRGIVYGLVAPLYEQSKVLAEVLVDAETPSVYLGSKLATKLKVMGVELASLGRINDIQEGDEVVSYVEPSRGVYKKLVIRNGALAAGCLLGEADTADLLMQMFHQEAQVPERRADLLFGRTSGELGLDVKEIADETFICTCNQATKGAICSAIDSGKTSLSSIAATTKAGTGCGGCRPLVQQLIDVYAMNAIHDPSENWYVPGVPYDKPDLIREVTARRLKSVSAVLNALGNGNEDAETKTGLASLLRSVWNDEYVDERDHRFINDRVHANIQNDGTFSVVPRMYGGVTTPDQLRRIADVADKYQAKMVKVTGGQRIDLLGVKKEDLPAIWEELDMPSGHAYTKAFRTCKTCVGTEFCRYGVGDSTGLGIKVEQKFQGLEFPHKMKLAASGCPRNCAESSTKDVGYIAVEDGWDVLIGGAAGSRVRAGD
ncbi:MAG: nitrite reductase large subunit NirB, partial [Candidatus Poribacteria bacterium]|nr:nitrite reductase large subunit NirB [Candidatus Poribacteria bacterium]